MEKNVKYVNHEEIRSIGKKCRMFERRYFFANGEVRRSLSFAEYVCLLLFFVGYRKI